MIGGSMRLLFLYWLCCLRFLCRDSLVKNRFKILFNHGFIPMVVYSIFVLLFVIVSLMCVLLPYFWENYTRHFEDTDLFEKMFARLLAEVAANSFLDTESLFIDGTHIKASANAHKYRNEVLQKEVQVYEKELQEKIEKDRSAHGKKPLKESQKGFCIYSEYLL